MKPKKSIREIIEAEMGRRVDGYAVQQAMAVLDELIDWSDTESHPAPIVAFHAHPPWSLYPYPGDLTSYPFPAYPYPYTAYPYPYTAYPQPYTISASGTNGASDGE